MLELLAGCGTESCQRVGSERLQHGVVGGEGKQ